jgi:RimJ/RimL family protein N-acetyltransferase
VSDPLCIETPRLRIRWLRPEDNAFILRLVNDPDWLRHIGDRKVSNLDEARDFIENGACAMYARCGFGLNRVALKACDTPVGICGLLQREGLPSSDLGYALLPEYRNRGYALEAARAVLAQAVEQLAQTRVCAIVSAENRASIRLLDHLGFHYDRQISMPPGNETVDLYRIQLPG